MTPAEITSLAASLAAIATAVAAIWHSWQTRQQLAAHKATYQMDVHTPPPR